MNPRQITTVEEAESLADLCQNRFRIVGFKVSGKPLGDGWLYTFPLDELRRFRHDRDMGRIISVKGPIAGGRSGLRQAAPGLLTCAPPR